jgi:hypothetical protein
VLLLYESCGVRSDHSILTFITGERDFEDLKLLISHQKAKHFKCDRCGRRLNTAGGTFTIIRIPTKAALTATGLSVHMNQVHKENLTQVENALPSRQGLEVEIFGMEGIPQDMLDQHRNRILQNFQQAQKDRQIATGNPLPGQGHAQKKIKTESPEELKQRLAEFRKRKKEIAANGGVDPAAAANTETQPQAPFVSTFSLRVVWNMLISAERLLPNPSPSILRPTTRLPRTTRQPSPALHLLRQQPPCTSIIRCATRGRWPTSATDTRRILERWCRWRRY